MATEKQVRYALFLMRNAGLPTDWMCASHKMLGAKMRERTGTVEDWLRGLNVARASEVIDRLLKLIEAQRARQAAPGKTGRRVILVPETPAEPSPDRGSPEES